MFFSCNWKSVKRGFQRWHNSKTFKRQTHLQQKPHFPFLPWMKPGQEVYVGAEQRSWLIGHKCELVRLCNLFEWLVNLKSPTQFGCNVVQQVIVASCKFASASIFNGYYILRTMYPCRAQRWYCSLSGDVYEVHANLSKTLIGDWIYDQTDKRIKVQLANDELLIFSPVESYGFAIDNRAWLWYS